MKRYILLIVLLGLMFPLHSQIFEEHRKVLYPPKVKEFIENTDKFVTKNVYHIEGRLILSVIILTDFTTNSKIGYLEYTKKSIPLSLLLTRKLYIIRYAGK